MIKKFKSYWMIDGNNEPFPTLNAAKFHCWMGYTEKERIKYLCDNCIYHVVNEEVVSSVTISVNEKGVLGFSRPRKLTY